MAFVKVHQPCTECASSDGAGINEDGSAFCFSCHTHIKNYTNKLNGTINQETEFEIHQRNKKMEDFNQPSSKTTASFVELTDRKISLATAKKYGVKASLSLLQKASVTLWQLMS